MHMFARETNTRGHYLKMQLPATRIDVDDCKLNLYSFSPSMIKLWNLRTAIKLH